MKKNYRTSVKLFLLFFIPSFLVFFGIVMSFLVQESKSQQEILMAKEIQIVEKLRRIANDEIKAIISDLFFLSVHQKLRQVLENDKPVLRQKLAEEFSRFSSTSKRYDQIRFLNETGMEHILINFNKNNPVIVSEDKLQNKAKRYYFTDTFTLEAGRIFISPFDLNIEHGQIQQPLKPMIRFGTPVKDLSGQKRGIVLLNYFGAKLIKNLENALSSSFDSFVLLNTQGYWLKGQNPDDEWGFMYNDRKDRTFATRYPETWRKVIAENDGQFLNDMGLYTFTTILPLGDVMLSSTGSINAYQKSKSIFSNDNYFWKIVMHITNKDIKALKIGIFYTWLPYLGAISILIVFLSFAFSVAVSQRKKAVEAKIQKEKLQSILEMAGAVCHEMNQPLMCISGFAELLADDLSMDSIQKENLSEIKNQVEKLGTITSKLMTVTKYKTKKYLKGNIIDIEAASKRE